MSWVVKQPHTGTSTADLWPLQVFAASVARRGLLRSVSAASSGLDSVGRLSAFRYVVIGL